jgi:hypothetical protein
VHVPRGVSRLGELVKRLFEAVCWPVDGSFRHEAPVYSATTIYLALDETRSPT